MELQEIINYCAEKPGTTKSFPFDETTLVFKAAGKMFSLLNLNPPYSINLKCDPLLAEELRFKYQAVKPGYHMNKVHWNTVRLDGSIAESLLKRWIDDSYDLVVSKLSIKIRSKLKSDSPFTPK